MVLLELLRGIRDAGKDGREKKKKNHAFRVSLET